MVELYRESLINSFFVIPEVLIGNPASLILGRYRLKTLDSRLKIAGMTEEGCFFTGHYWFLDALMPLLDFRLKASGMTI